MSISMNDRFQRHPWVVEWCMMNVSQWKLLKCQISSLQNPVEEGTGDC